MGPQRRRHDHRDWNAAEGESFGELQAQANHTSFYIYQTVRHTRLYDEYGSNVGYKDGHTGTTGYVGVRLSSREVEYPDQDPDDCGYFSDFDLNQPSVVGSLTFRGSYGVCPTQDGWVYCAGWATGFTWVPPSGWDAADIRLNVYKDTNGPMWVDGVRLQGED